MTTHRRRPRWHWPWLVLLALPWLCGPALAWNAAGHRLVVLMAEPELTPAARAALQPLLGGERLVDAAVWLDEEKDVLAARMPGSRRWHYDARPLCEPATGPARWCRGGHCASEQLRRHLAVLADGDADPEARRFALRVVLHLVADVHQPLHAANDDDGGGNDRPVTWPGVKRPVTTSLHAAWDGGLWRDALRGQDERQLARRWWNDTPAAERAAWRAGDVSAWLEESHALARGEAYGALPGWRCGAEAAAPAPLDEAYLLQARARVRQQLVKAAVRLADLLNRTLR